jgi:DNA-binding response OmpR family regulator
MVGFFTDPPAAVARRQLGAAPFMKLPVLLFDPDPVAGRVLAMQLRHAGFATYVVFEGAAAITSTRGKQFASIVVVADLADSQMRHCLHQIREADRDAWLIVISNPTVPRSRQVVRELGGDATMDMPFTVSDLAQRLSVLPPRVRPAA